MRSSRLSRIAISFLVLLIWLTVSGAAQQQAAAPAPDSSQPSVSADAQNGIPALQTREPHYRVNKTDVLQLTFTFTPEYDQNVTVGPDGYIVPRGVGDIYVEGKTLPEVTAALQKAYAKILHDPLISVIPTTVVPAYFIAGGEIGKPGKYTFQGDTTVSQAVQIAGGFTADAKHSQVVLYRRINNDWVQGQRIDVKKMLKDGNLAEDLHLQNGDMLYVPKNFISKVQPWLTPVSQFVKLNLFTKPITFGN